MGSNLSYENSSVAPRHSTLLQPYTLRANRHWGQSADTWNSHHNAPSSALTDTGHSSPGSSGHRKRKRLLQSKMWWPGIDKDVEKPAGDRLSCQATGPAMSSTSVQMSELPTHPRHLLYMDFCGPFPNGEMLFVVIDEYSRFPEAKIMRCITV